MRVRMLFLKDVPPKYLAGEVREVARGYARNYLIPRDLAVLATPDQLKRGANARRTAEEGRKVQANERGVLAARLEGATITIPARAGEGGRLYGSVTNILISQEIQKGLGATVDRRLIDLPDPIRELGTFKVPIRFGPELTATITVQVESPTQAASVSPTETSTPSEPTAAREADDVRGEDPSG